MYALFLPFLFRLKSKPHHIFLLIVCMDWQDLLDLHQINLQRLKDTQIGWNNSFTSKTTVAQKCSAAMEIQKYQWRTDRPTYGLTWVGACLKISIQIISSPPASKIPPILRKRLNFGDLQLAVQGGGKKVVWSWQPGREEIMILAVLDWDPPTPHHHPIRFFFLFCFSSFETRTKKNSSYILCPLYWAQFTKNPSPCSAWL